MNKLLGVMLVIAGTAGVAMAGSVAAVPEINPATAVSALALLGGSILVIRARLKK